MVGRCQASEHYLARWRRRSCRPEGSGSGHLPSLRKTGGKVQAEGPYQVNAGQL
jgi:hypothetical protein